MLKYACHGVDWSRIWGGAGTAPAVSNTEGALPRPHTRERGARVAEPGQAALCGKGRVCRSGGMRAKALEVNAHRDKFLFHARCECISQFLPTVVLQSPCETWRNYPVSTPQNL